MTNPTDLAERIALLADDMKAHAVDANNARTSSSCAASQSEYSRVREELHAAIEALATQARPSAVDVRDAGAVPASLVREFLEASAYAQKMDEHRPWGGGPKHGTAERMNAWAKVRRLRGLIDASMAATPPAAQGKQAPSDNNSTN